MLAANQELVQRLSGGGHCCGGLATAQWNVVLFFLGCVLVAALYGAYSVKKRIFMVQGVPAIAALIAVGG